MYSWHTISYSTAITLKILISFYTNSIVLAYLFCNLNISCATPKPSGISTIRNEWNGNKWRLVCMIRNKYNLIQLIRQIFFSDFRQISISLVVTIMIWWHLYIRFAFCSERPAVESSGYINLTQRSNSSLTETIRVLPYMYVNSHCVLSMHICCMYGDIWIINCIVNWYDMAYLTTWILGSSTNPVVSHPKAQ